jgi:deazaflavin-dependent oxidoreductase (nitroreductase family)
VSVLWHTTKWLGGYAVFAANRGLDHDPAWLRDLQARPRTVVEVGTRTLSVKARIAQGEERTRLIEERMRRLPFIADFVRTSRRALPVVVLEVK